MVSFIRGPLLSTAEDWSRPEVLFYPVGRDEDTDLKNRGQPAVARSRPAHWFAFLADLRYT